MSVARSAIRELLARLPDERRQEANVQHLAEAARATPTDIVHLIYGQAAHELESQDYASRVA